YNNTKKLPQDRESVFWFNVLQVPPTNIGSDSGQNKMLVMLRSSGEQVLAGASDDTTPTLLIQAEEERVVDNRTHDRFCEIRAAAG
ncbi:fimbria/pilus periplasmic chaperone, partial [Salmonella enterica subsp. enterica serovar Anatum]|nr:fimbria/pilus periplasmic chaperone [Salmonella enterica subsp. enterica serovar Anatum]